ncbi:hypothetical protein, partial [Nocardia uniformis]
MSRVADLNARYQRSARYMSTGVQIVAIGDFGSARVDAAVRRVLILAQNDALLWADLLGASKALRSRLVTQPQPLQFNVAVRQAAAAVVDESATLRHQVGPAARQVVDELAAAAYGAAAVDPRSGEVLLKEIQQAGAGSCVVIAASGSAVAGLASWLNPQGFTVCGVQQLIRDQLFVARGYAVGPPRFFPSSLVTAPMTESLSYVMPTWFRDRAIPQSGLAERAEGAIVVPGRLSVVGDTAEQVPLPVEGAVDEEELLPQATWIQPDAPPREPSSDEVAARLVLLGGGYAMWLDDGERIRAVDPTQPGGGRVTTVEVTAVRPGTYLLLRDGETERRALYNAALELMGSEANDVETSQTLWKAALQAKLNQLGRTAVTRELTKVGVRT